MVLGAYPADRRLFFLLVSNILLNRQNRIERRSPLRKKKSKWVLALFLVLFTACLAPCGYADLGGFLNDTFDFIGRCISFPFEFIADLFN